MKLMLKSGLLLLLGLLLQSGGAQAQVRVNVNVGAPAPVWGPAVGPGVQYYYLPEIDGYYDLYTQNYVYLDPYGYWVSTPYLPSYYASYDPRFFHPVAISYVGRQPWGYIYDHRAYCGQRGWQPGYYRGNRGGYGYNNGGRGYGYNVPQPNYRSSPGRYSNNPYNNRGYARSNSYDHNNRNGYGQNGRDNRNYQNAPGRSNRDYHSDGGREAQNVPGSNPGRGRGR